MKPKQQNGDSTGIVASAEPRVSVNTLADSRNRFGRTPEDRLALAKWFRKVSSQYEDLIDQGWDPDEPSPRAGLDGPSVREMRDKSLSVAEGIEVIEAYHALHA